MCNKNHIILKGEINGDNNSKILILLFSIRLYGYKATT